MGLTVVDAGVLIGFLDANDAHHPAAHTELTAALSRNDRLVLPAAVAALAAVRDLVERVPIRVEPLEAEI